MSNVTSSDSYESAVQQARKSRKTNLILCVGVIAAFLIYSLFFQSPSISVAMDGQAFGVIPLEDDGIVFYLSDVDSIEFHEALSEFDRGSLQSGLEEDSCYSGTYVNDAFGEYQLHVNLKPDCYIVFHYAGGILVCNSDTEKNTRELYDDLLEAINT